jgi:hypothetical protein
MRSGSIWTTWTRPAARHGAIIYQKADRHAPARRHPW